MRHDLMLGKLAIALRRARGDAVRCGLPLIDAAPYEVSDRDLAWFDVGAAAEGSDQPGKLDLGLAFGALKAA
jgi:hypothetical protein